MKHYQERVVAEKAELDKRLESLNAFLTNGPLSLLSVQEIRRLNRQLRYMELYTNVLAERIAEFKG